MTNPFLDPQRIQAALNALGVRPNRDLGQNFLIDGRAIDAAVEAAELSSDDTVVEVGPGLGVLTYEVVQHAGQVIAIEFDRRLAARLPEQITSPRLQVIQSDVLRVDPATAVAAPRYKVVANLPYQITSAILRHFLEATKPPALMVVMVQWEVAQRIVATPPDMSVLAHSVQFYAEAEIVERVPARSFLPAPKVDSAILRLRRRPEPLVAVDDVNAFFRVIKAGFLHARKKLGNSLPGGLAAMGVALPKDAAMVALERAGVDSNRRAETLTAAEWGAVYRELVRERATLSTTNMTN
jgi:16S rRNA (adenine1518-N6/adenine1519-N6)-dimethyltransferase